MRKTEELMHNCITNCFTRNTRGSWLLNRFHCLGRVHPTA